MSAWLWLLVPLAPLLGTLALLLLRERALAWLWASCLPALLATLLPPLPLELPWLWEGVRWGGDDLLTRAWLGFSTVLWGAAAVFASSSLAGDPRRLRFWTFWQLALAGNLLLIIAADALSFYLGFSAMSLSAYGLIVQRGGPGPRRAGRLYLQLAICGEIALLAGLLLRSHASELAFTFASWQAQPIDHLTLALLLLGLGLKAGFWPLHVWLPLAHPEAPAPASAVLSGAMLKAGLLGLWRCMPQADPTLQAWSTPLLLVGLFGAFYAALLGLGSSNAKAVLAWSSVSQMGWMLMILGLAWSGVEPSAALLVLTLFGVHHGLAKGALFLAAGLLHDHRVPRAAWLLVWLPALAIMGAPLTSGAAVKSVFKDLWHSSAFSAWEAWLSLASLATALLLLRALWLMREDQRQASAQHPPLARWLPWAVLGGAPLLLGSWAPLREPWLASLHPGGLWAAGWPLLAAAGLAALALRSGWRTPRALRRRQRDPVALFSLRLKHLVQRPPLTPPEPRVDRRRWRQRERRWNRFWQQGALAVSACLLAGLLWLGWWW